MTRQFKNVAHSLDEGKQRSVFCPKYHYKILESEVAPSISQKLYQRCQQKEGVAILELKVQSDPVQVVLSISPKCEVAKVVGYPKGKTPLGAFDHFPPLRKRYWGQHF